jgi:hypothetical protein
MDLTTNGVVITDAIKFVQISKEKLTLSSKDDNGSKESEEPDDQLEEKQEEETGKRQLRIQPSDLITKKNEKDRPSYDYQKLL